jgi:alginate O-acetyltransferase complex protein AlgI
VSFTDKSFLYFLPIFYVLWLATRRHHTAKLVAMLVGSLVFYSFNRWWTLPIILAFSVVDWATARAIAKTRQPFYPLVAGVTFNLGLLCYWKYTPLAVHTLAGLFGWKLTGDDIGLAGNWVIPIGISFYSFSGISYMVDVYRGLTPSEPSLLGYSLFTSFFPHLVAGPILRAREFLVHLRPEELPDRPIDPWEGTFLMARGYFKKAVLADSIAVAIDPFFAHVGDPSTAGVWSLPYVYLYALQIYFDFSGYTDIARGLGLWFGFRWPENFNLPYFATSVQDFWRRWHMTLSRFLRDYLYIPLGGNRGGFWRTSATLVVTMLLGGLWHGASWSFAVWGALHGLFLVANRHWGQTLLHVRLANLSGQAARIWTMVRIVLTFHAVCFAWCFFRLTDIRDSFACIGKWFLFDADKMFAGGSGSTSLWLAIAAYLAAAACAMIVTRHGSISTFPRLVAALPFARGASWGVAISMLMLAFLLAPGGDKPPFIYFAF